MFELPDILGHTYFGNTVWAWTIAAAVATVVLLILLMTRRLFRAYYARLAATPNLEIVELPVRVVSRTTVLFMSTLAVFVGAHTLALTPQASRLLWTIVTISTFWQAGLWASTAAMTWLDHKRRTKLAVDRAAVGTLGILSFITRALIWALVLLLTLDNLGVNITALVAGLGIGGIAVALAVQNVLSDLLASLSITLDRPFVVGDALGLDDFSGTVEYIGVKSTRLRSTNGEQIIIPNSNLLSSRIRNYSRMQQRRVLFTLSLAYDTPKAQLAALPEVLKAIIEAEPDVRFDRAHFFRFGTASLDFEVVYFVRTADYTVHMDAQQRILLNIMEHLEREGIRFAYPTQRLLLEGDSEQKEEAPRA